MKQAHELVTRGLWRGQSHPCRALSRGLALGTVGLLSPRASDVRVVWDTARGGLWMSKAWTRGPGSSLGTAHLRDSPASRQGCGGEQRGPEWKGPDRVTAGRCQGHRGGGLEGLRAGQRGRLLCLSLRVQAFEHVAGRSLSWPRGRPSISSAVTVRSPGVAVNARPPARGSGFMS